MCCCSVAPNHHSTTRTSNQSCLKGLMSASQGILGDLGTTLHKILRNIFSSHIFSWGGKGVRILAYYYVLTGGNACRVI